MLTGLLKLHGRILAWLWHDFCGFHGRAEASCLPEGNMTQQLVVLPLDLCGLLSSAARGGQTFLQNCGKCGVQTKHGSGSPLTAWGGNV